MDLKPKIPPSETADTKLIEISTKWLKKMLETDSSFSVRPWFDRHANLPPVESPRDIPKKLGEFKKYRRCFRRTNWREVLLCSQANNHIVVRVQDVMAHVHDELDEVIEVFAMRKDLENTGPQKGEGDNQREAFFPVLELGEGVEVFATPISTMTALSAAWNAAFLAAEGS